MDRIYPRFIVVHHTAGHDVPALEINRYHAGEGFGVLLDSPGPLAEEYAARGFTRVSGGVLVCIGYHYIIRADGTREKGRPDFMRGAHCNVRNMNFASIGVALTGNFDSRDNPLGVKGHMHPTEYQLEALRGLLFFLMDVYAIPRENVLLHREVAATSCPGDRFTLPI